MNRYIGPLTFLFVAFIFSACAQPTVKRNYTDMIIKGNKIFTLTKEGTIHVLNLTNGSLIDTNLRADTAITAIAINRKKNIVVVIGNRRVATLNEENLKFADIFKSTNRIYQVVYDKQNRSYLVTNKGIEVMSSKEVFKPDTAMRNNKQGSGWLYPSVIFIDGADNIWLGSDDGEWGGELFIFNTVKRQFIKPKMNGFRMDLNPVRSFCTDGKVVYMSCSLAHMTISGAIVKFVGYNCEELLKSETKNRFTANGVDGEYIGPVCYNKKDSCIYFYSQHGIFKGNSKRDLTVLKSWEKITGVRLNWQGAQINAVGSPMNVLKMFFADNNNLYLLTQNDGIGVYNGEKFSLLN